MKIQQAAIGALACLALLAVSPASNAADAPAAKAKSDVTWVYPVIPKFGAVHPRPDAAAQLDPNADYKVFVDVVSTPKNMGEAFPALWRLARLVNLMGYARVPPDHVHIVALLDEKAAAAAFSNAIYQKRFKKDNPNLEILHALHKAGVTLLICGQMMAGAGFADSDIDPSVTVSLSALSDPVVYEHEGYTYMRL